MRIEKARTYANSNYAIFNQPKKNHHEIKSKFLLGQVPAHLGNYRNVVSRGSRNEI